MKLAMLMWLASLMPQPVADPLCLATTIYLEARDQPELGQRAVAEVALRRRDSGLWGDSLCAVVTAPAQFAPGIVHPGHLLKNPRAFERAARIAFDSLRHWRTPDADRREVVPGASHFAAHALANPAWARRSEQVAVIGDHSFYRVTRL